MTSSAPPGPAASGLPPACPDCGAPFETERPVRCGRCRLPLTGVAAATLWQVTLALQSVEAQRLVLLRQRDDLLAGLRARRDEPGGVPVAPPPWGPPPPATGRPEVSGRSAQTVLLVLGGLLVTVAALAFTVVSWGHLGIGGRAAVLAVLTGCALALPSRLRRRGLTATAETSAAVGLALVLLDLFAARAADLAGLGGTDGAGYWAVATALTGAGAAAYGWALRLRVPLVAGFLLGRLPGLLAAQALGLGGVDAAATAMVATAAVDQAVLRAVAGRGGPAGAPAQVPAGGPEGAGPAPAASGGAPRNDGGLAALLPAAGLFAVLWGGLGALLAGQASLSAALLPGVTGAAADERLAVTGWAWLPLGGFAVLTAVLSLRRPTPGHLVLPPAARRLAASLAGTALLVAAGGTIAVPLARDWAAIAYAAPAALLAVATGALLRRGTGRTQAGPAAAGTSGAALPLGMFYAAAFTLLVSSTASLGGIVPAVFAPLGHVPAAWADGPAPSWEWSVAPAAVSGLWLLLLVLAVLTALRLTGSALGLVAGPAASAATTGPELPRSAPVTTGPVGFFAVATALVGVPALALLPVALGSGYGAAVAVAAALAVLAAGYAMPRPAGPAGRVALATAAVLALLWAPADRAATITVLAVLALLSTALTVRASASASASASAGAVPGPRAALPAACAVLAAGAEAAAVAATAGLDLPAVMLAVLGVAIASAAVAARAAGAVSRAVEGAGYLLGAVALLLTVGEPGRLSFALAVAGTALLGVALRPERRRAASVAATGLLIGSSWIRLALSGVGTTEAYTLTVAVAALVIGVLHRRRFPGAGSWPAYGPGLGLGLLPSLLAVWADGGWLRPLLLGSAALVVTVLGGRLRLHCPLLLGGATLLLVAVHELAPAVVQVLGLLPRWVPLAAAGLLLLVLGATYEQRLRDARRLRTSLSRLH
ncbi:SCO7613 C-terminal domain-containing membrane protein [Kitasatospora herbaricolor]|uniref:SCO7613 C-terminal domain-containing membrane protein n=1 Tax=Kitasatospora herbaricolor TaxID=68217 RepID=UPI0036DBFB20